MSRGFFITGTDTGVGKTVIAGLIIRALSILGFKTAGMKPVETGCIRQKDVLIPSDGTFLKNVSHMDEGINHIVPYCLEAPLAPMTASEMEGIDISPEKIKGAFDELKRRYDAVVVEGIGGLLVPLKKDYFVLDMIKDMGLPLIVVTRPSLGTINHTLLTVRYAKMEGIEIAGIIINYSSPSQGTQAEETSPHVISVLSPVPVIGIIPHLSDLGKETLEKIATKSLLFDIIRKYL
ncbi:MAG: dethiobiotin synthase [Nitrospirae bacterium]|nr:dethiobiotin synthase [Nitrospirota bacterium]